MKMVYLVIKKRVHNDENVPPPPPKKKKKNHGFLLFVLPWHDDMIQYIYIERHLYSTGKL